MFKHKLCLIVCFGLVFAGKWAHAEFDIKTLVAGHFSGLYSNENSNAFTEQSFGLSYIPDMPVGIVIDGSQRKYAHDPASNYNSFEFMLRGYAPVEPLHVIIKPSIGYRWANRANSATTAELGLTPAVKGSLTTSALLGMITIGAKSFYYNNRTKEEIALYYPQQEVGAFMRLSFPLYF